MGNDTAETARRQGTGAVAVAIGTWWQGGCRGPGLSDLFDWKGEKVCATCSCACELGSSTGFRSGDEMNSCACRTPHLYLSPCLPPGASINPRLWRPTSTFLSTFPGGHCRLYEKKKNTSATTDPPPPQHHSSLAHSCGRKAARRLFQSRSPSMYRYPAAEGQLVVAHSPSAVGPGYRAGSKCCC